MAMPTSRAKGPSILPRAAKPDKKPDSVTFLSYVKSLFNRISWVLPWHNIKYVGLPPKKISGILWSVKDDLELKTPGVYSIQCESGQVYIGQTGNLTDIRL